jgi:hypothetical protein
MDYQMQLMLLEQQNKKRLLMARQEQDAMTQLHEEDVRKRENTRNAPGSAFPSDKDQYPAGTSHDDEEPKVQTSGADTPDSGKQSKTRTKMPINYTISEDLTADNVRRKAQFVALQGSKKMGLTLSDQHIP